MPLTIFSEEPSTPNVSPHPWTVKIHTTYSTTYGILSEDGHLKNAAILLFGKEPLRFFPGVEFHIGRFGMNEADLIFQDVVEGNILQMADKVVALLRSKYLISPIHYEGMQRIEPLEIPEDALREMIYNSLVHKLYVGVPIQMWVFNDHIELWNEGKLPDAITIDTLLKTFFPPSESTCRFRILQSRIYRIMGTRYS